MDFRDKILNELTERYYFDKEENIYFFNQILDLNIRLKIMSDALILLSQNKKLNFCLKNEDDYNFKTETKVCKYKYRCSHKLENE